MNSLSFTKTSLDRSDRSSYFEYYNCVEGMEEFIKVEDPFHLVSVPEMEDRERSLWGRGELGTYGWLYNVQMLLPPTQG